MAPARAPEVGVVLGDRYRLERLIARGGMSDVYEATDQLLGRRVAVKVYRTGAVADSLRFDVEVGILAALNHPGLVQIFDVGDHHGDGYVVLELIDGPTLAEIEARRGPLPEAEVRSLAMAVTDALAHVHAAGVVHRDITPTNILVGSDGRARLADFGIARLLDANRVTALAHTVGTAAYMAPEQVEGGQVGLAADVYSLGLVLLEALTGRPGFDGVGHEVLLARLTRDPDVATGVPAPWSPLLEAMTAQAPEQRPTAADLQDRIDALPAADLATEAVPVVDADDPPGRAGAPLAETTVFPALSGGTAVMPVVGRTDTDAPVSPGVDVMSEVIAGVWQPWWRRHVVALATLLVAVVVALALALAASGDGGGSVTPATAVPPATTVSTEVPGTIATPVTETAPAKEQGQGKGKGKH